MRYVYYPFDLFVLWPLGKVLCRFLDDVLPAIARAMSRALATTFRFLRDTLVDKILVPGAKRCFLLEPVLATVAAWEFASAATNEPTAYRAAPFAAASVAAASVALIVVDARRPRRSAPSAPPWRRRPRRVSTPRREPLPVLRRAVIWTYRAIAFVLDHLYTFFAAIATKLSAAFAAFMDRYVGPS